MTTDDTSSGQNTKYLVPPYKLYIDRKADEVRAHVTLHKIPPQFIEYDPTPTRFIVKTLKYSKKYYLDVPYPENVVVDANSQSESTLQYGVLRASLKIVSRNPVHEKHSSHEGNGQPSGKRKRSNEAENPSKKEKKKKRKTINPKGEKKRKNFATLEESLNIADEILNNEEERIAKQKTTETATQEWIESKKQKRQQRKEQKKQMKEQAKNEALSAINTRKRRRNAPPTTPIIMAQRVPTPKDAMDIVSNPFGKIISECRTMTPQEVEQLLHKSPSRSVLKKIPTPKSERKKATFELKKNETLKIPVLKKKQDSGILL